MKKNKVKKENPPALAPMDHVFAGAGMVIVYGTLVLGIFALVQRLVRLDQTTTPWCGLFSF